MESIVALLFSNVYFPAEKMGILLAVKVFKSHDLRKYI